MKLNGGYITQQWKWVYGISLAVLIVFVLLSIAYPGDADSSGSTSPIGTKVFYAGVFPGSLFVIVPLGAMLGLLLGVILYIGSSGRKLKRFLLLVAASLVVIWFALAFLGTLLGGVAVYPEVASASSGGHMYHLVTPSELWLGESQLILLECDRAGVRCRVIHNYSTYHIECGDEAYDLCGINLSIQAGAISIVYRGEVLDTYQPN
jgi:hypothetical protein